MFTKFVNFIVNHAEMLAIVTKIPSVIALFISMVTWNWSIVYITSLIMLVIDAACIIPVIWVGFKKPELLNED